MCRPPAGAGLGVAGPPRSRSREQRGHRPRGGRLSPSTATLHRAVFVGTPPPAVSPGAPCTGPTHRAPARPHARVLIPRPGTGRGPPAPCTVPSPGVVPTPPHPTLTPVGCPGPAARAAPRGRGGGNPPRAVRGVCITRNRESGGKVPPRREPPAPGGTPPHPTPPGPGSPARCITQLITTINNNKERHCRAGPPHAHARPCKYRANRGRSCRACGDGGAAEPRVCVRPPPAPPGPPRTPRSRKERGRRALTVSLISELGAWGGFF